MKQPAMSDEFLTLISPCQSRLFGYLYSMLHNLDDTEDVLQQAVLAMWRNFGSFDRERNFLPWAMQYAKLTAMNHIRARQRNRMVFSEELVAMIADTADSAEDIDSQEAYQEALLRCMDKLSSTDLGLVRLCYFEKCNIKAAAERLGRAPQSVCNSLRRIRGLLFDCIERSVGEEDSP